MGISRSAGALNIVCRVDLALVGNCGAREGSAWGAAGGRHPLYVVFLCRDQYRHDGRHVPIVGIPLPLMSYGGSATVMTMASLGLLLNVKRRRLSFF